MITPRRFHHEIRFFHLNSGLTDRIFGTMHMRDRWILFCTALFEIQRSHDFTAHAFVLMGNHFHLLFSTATGKEHILAEEFHAVLNRLCNLTWDALETPLFCEPIVNVEYYKHAYKYVYRNPLDAGLCYRVEDYEYSTLRGLLGRSALAVPVIDNMGLVFGPGKVLDWLNHESAELSPRFRGADIRER
jgi:putative transposase